MIFGPSRWEWTIDSGISLSQAGVLTLSLISIAEIPIPFIISGSICLLKLGFKKTKRGPYVVLSF